MAGAVNWPRRWPAFELHFQSLALGVGHLKTADGNFNPPFESR